MHMKSQFLLFPLFLLVSHSSIGQDLWPHENAEWWFELGPWLYSPSIEHRYVDGDTLINNINCTRIITDRYWSYNPNSTDLNLNSSTEEIVYFNGDTLFWWKFDDFYPLICFNAQVGDSWFPLPQNDEFGCDYNPVTVENIGTEVYNGQTFRKITMSPFDEETSTFYWGGTFDERTFWREYGYPAYNACGSIVEWFTFSFRCYNDDELTIIESDGECDEPLSIDQRIDDEVFFRVYPNPINTGEYINIEGAEIKSIFSLSGQKMKFDPSIKRIIIPEGTAPGIYFVELSLPKGGISYSKMLIR